VPVIVVAPLRWSRSPLQSFFLLLLAVTGLLITLNISRNAVTVEMGEPWASFWGTSIFLGSSVAVIGSYWKDKISGMLIERSGILLLGGASVIWPAALVLSVGWEKSGFSAVITFIFAMFCFLQVRYINKHIQLILEAIKKEAE